MAARGPHSLTNRQILDFCKVLYEQLSLTQNIALLRTEGLLRVSGEYAAVGALQERYVFDGEIPELTTDNVHAMIGCLKRSLLEIKGIGEIDLSERSELLCVVDRLSDEAEEQAETVRAFNSYIEQLAVSRDREKNEIAEILYTLIRLGQLIVTQQASNKMTVNNCAVILGPKISEMLRINEPDTAPAIQMSRTENFNQVIGMIISSDEYQRTFIEQFGEQECQAREAALRSARRECKSARARERLMSEAYQEAEKGEQALSARLQALTLGERSSMGARRMSVRNLLPRKSEATTGEVELGAVREALGIESARKATLSTVLKDSRQFRRLQTKKVVQAGASLGRLKMKALQEKARAAQAGATADAVEVDLRGNSSDGSSSGDDSVDTKKPRRRPHKR